MRFLGDKRSILLQLISIAAVGIFAACNQPEQKTTTLKLASPLKTTLIQPFRFHKTLEVSPDNIFDVFSWGRGSNKTGAYLILESDSSGAKYTTTTGDLDGQIADVYNTDMDMDGNPEILIQTKAKDSTQHVKIDAFEYKDNRAQKLDFPKLTSSQKKGYRGDDQFYIKEGGLMREFPVYNGSEADAKPTGEKRVLAYGIRNNSFTVKTVEAGNEKKATTSTASDSTTKAAGVPASAPAKTSTKNSGQKKHHRVAEKRHQSHKKTTRKSSSHSSKKHRRHRR